MGPKKEAAGKDGGDSPRMPMQKQLTLEEAVADGKAAFHEANMVFE